MTYETLDLDMTISILGAILFLVALYAVYRVNPSVGAGCCGTYVDRSNARPDVTETTTQDAPTVKSRAAAPVEYDWYDRLQVDRMVDEGGPDSCTMYE